MQKVFSFCRHLRRVWVLLGFPTERCYHYKTRVPIHFNTDTFSFHNSSRVGIEGFLTPLNTNFTHRSTNNILPRVKNVDGKYLRSLGFNRISRRNFCRHRRTNFYRASACQKCGNLFTVSTIYAVCFLARAGIRRWLGSQT